MDEITNGPHINRGGPRGAVPPSRPVMGGARRYRPTTTMPQQNVAVHTQRQQGGHIPPQKKNAGSKSGKKSEKTIFVLDKIVAVCVFMLFFGLPLFFINITYQGIIFEKQYYFYFWIFIGIIAWAARGILGGKIEIRRTSLDIPLGILWLVYVFATIFSVDKFHSFFGFFGNPINGLISVTSLILAYYLIVSYISKKRVILMWWAIMISGSIVVLWSFLVTMRLIPQNILSYVVPSLTGSFTGLAMFLAMMLPIFIVSVSLVDNKMQEGIKAKIIIILLFIITVLNLITMSLLFGYVRWYITIVAIALLLVFTVSYFVEVSQKTNAMAVFVFLLLVGFLIYGQPIFTRTTIQPEASLNYNLSFDIAKNAVKNKPLLGSGPGTYGYDFSLYRPKELNRTGQYDIRFYSDKGILVESISTTGLIGLITLIVVFLTYISTVVHAFMHSKDQTTRILSLGLFVTSIISSLYVLLWAVDGLLIIYSVLIAALTIGLLRDGAEDGSDNKLTLSMTSTPQNALSFAFLAILVAVGVIFGLVTLGKMFVADVHAGSALKARAQNNFEESSKRFERAVSFNGQEGRYYTIISQYALDLANMELAKKENADNELVSRYISSATGAASVGRDLMPNDVLANETAGFIYENSGGYVQNALSQATVAYERARELEPQNPYLDIAVGKLKLLEAQTKSEGQTEDKTALINEAKTLFESARDKTTFEVEGQQISTFAPAYYYIAITEEALGNTDAAIEAMKMALQVAQMDRTLTQQQLLSRQINYGFNLARLLQIRGTDEDIKSAENILQQIIGVNDQEVNSYLSLGLLYERTGRKDEAVGEYKKILDIIPKDDEKARENIQNLIDTVEQGGSNIDQQPKQDVNDGINANEQAENKEEKTALLIVSGSNSGDQADVSRNILANDGYKTTVRNEDKEYDGVVIMYSGNANNDEVANIKNTLAAKFDNVTSERNDELTTIYNYDIVIVVGGEKKTGENTEQ